MEVTIDWINGLVYFLLGVLIVILVDNLRRKETGDDVKRGEEGVPREPEGPVGLDEVIGLDKALALKFYRELKKALRESRVRIGLISEECTEGRVAYDFVRETWVCIHKDGSVAPLGEEPVKEILDLEEADE